MDSRGLHPSASGPSATRSTASRLIPPFSAMRTCWPHSYGDRQLKPVRRMSSSRSSKGERAVREQVAAERRPALEQGRMPRQRPEDVEVAQRDVLARRGEARERAQLLAPLLRRERRDPRSVGVGHAATLSRRDGTPEHAPGTRVTRGGPGSRTPGGPADPDRRRRPADARSRGSADRERPRDGAAVRARGRGRGGGRRGCRGSGGDRRAGRGARADRRWPSRPTRPTSRACDAWWRRRSRGSAGSTARC